MEHQSVELIMQHLDKLADKLGVGATEIFGWYVRQIWVDFYRQFICMLIFGTLTLALYQISKKRCAKEDKEALQVKAETEKAGKKYEPPEALTVGGVYLIAFCISLGIFALVTIFLLFDNVPELLNMEYHAFNDLLYRIKLD